MNGWKEELERMSKLQRAKSVRSLTTLYTVVIGVALTMAIGAAVNPDAGLSDINMSSIFLFVAFIATLVPFYHGALRHLDEAYIEKSAHFNKDGLLLIDISLLLLHALVLVLLAQLIMNPGHFAWTLVALLSVDVVWGVFVHFATQAKSAKIYGRWSLINFVFVIITAAFLAMNEIFLGPASRPVQLSIFLAAGCTLRSVVDYVWCRRFYFPSS
jgi:hypothetical protein